jgi:hypothetical protein
MTNQSSGDAGIKATGEMATVKKVADETSRAQNPQAAREVKGDLAGYDHQTGPGSNKR